jgi:hypothetical protein
MKRKESKGSAWAVVKRLGGALVFCLLAMLAAETYAGFGNPARAGGIIVAFRLP